MVDMILIKGKAKAEKKDQTAMMPKISFCSKRGRHELLVVDGYMKIKLTSSSTRVSNNKILRCS